MSTAKQVRNQQAISAQHLSRFLGVGGDRIVADNLSPDNLCRLGIVVRYSEDTGEPIHALVEELPRFSPCNQLGVFVQAWLPASVSETVQRTIGFSIYRNVLVQWDEDYDMRVLRLIDQMPPRSRQLLVAVHEHEGSVWFLWERAIPCIYSGLYESYSELEIEGDTWSIIGSAIVPSINVR